MIAINVFGRPGLFTKVGQTGSVMFVTYNSLRSIELEHLCCPVKCRIGAPTLPVHNCWFQFVRRKSGEMHVDDGAPGLDCRGRRRAGGTEPAHVVTLRRLVLCK